MCYDAPEVIRFWLLRPISLLLSGGFKRGIWLVWVLLFKVDDSMQHLCFPRLAYRTCNRTVGIVECIVAYDRMFSTVVIVATLKSEALICWRGEGQGLPFQAMDKKFVVDLMKMKQWETYFLISLLLSPKFGLSPKLSQKEKSIFRSHLYRTLDGAKDLANRLVQSSD